MSLDPPRLRGLPCGPLLAEYRKHTEAPVVLEAAGRRPRRARAALLGGLAAAVLGIWLVGGAPSAPPGAGGSEGTSGTAPGAGGTGGGDPAAIRPT